MKIKVMVCRVMTPCNDVIRYQRFGGAFSLHLQFTLKMEAACSSELLVLYTSSLHGVITQKTTIQSSL